ncbi:MAG: sulfotransferase [Leptolyngbya sp. SIO1D8]|nr:sulfotransferase [Leptolyngbya sp. SIO1D8]
MFQQSSPPKIQTSLAPTFVVGLGRSGTTLLRNLLNASNQIHIPYESDFIARAYPTLHQKTAFDEQDYEKIAQAFSSRSQKNGWHMQKNYLLSCLKERSPKNFAEVNAAIYEAYLKKEGLEALQWGIKTPVLIQSIDRILDVFPNARVVHIVRDGRDVYLSYKNIHEHGVNQEKFGPSNILQSTLFWVDGLRKVEESVSSAEHSLSQSVYEVRFEDLLKDTDAELEKLFNFLGMAYDASIPDRYLNYEGNQKLLCLQKHHENTVNSKLKQGIDGKNTAKYLSKMTKLERLTFELIAAPYLKKYGYTAEFSILNSPLFAPVRSVLYFSARQFNAFRYQKRDQKTAQLLSSQ